MRLTFRAKLMTIVGTAALAFVVLTVINALIAERVEQQLAVIQTRYVPKVELGPKLEGHFEHLRRGLQDAVAAQDTGALVATRALKDALLERLDEARAAVDARDAVALRGAVEDYYASATEVSRRLIAGETGEALVDTMAAMQAKQNRTAALIGKITAFDRGKLAQAFVTAARAEAAATRIRLAVSASCLVLVLLLSLGLSRGVLRSMAELAAGFERFGKGDFADPIRIEGRDELGELALHANQMAANLRRLNEERAAADWLKSGDVGLVRELHGELEPNEVAGHAVRFLTQYLEAPAAALYYAAEDGAFQLLAQHATWPALVPGEATPSFRPGEGLVGQAAQQQEILVIRDLPPDYFRIRSGLGETGPRTVVLIPIVHLGRVTGVLELACLKPWTGLAGELVSSMRDTLAIKIEVARSRAALRELLAKTQRQAQHLASQDDELRATNEELQAQQEELRHTNEELTRQAEQLEGQQRILEEKNAELDEARCSLEHKAAELTTVSAYKTQFLANMSHELRTPLNSLLLLSNLLAANEAGNLTDKQVEFCKTIHGAGEDLLALINQVLDLAKVEAGKQDLNLGPVSLHQLVEHARQIFEPLARDRGLNFSAEVAPGVPETISTDLQRVEQVLNNLLGNAIKFTERGGVTLRIGPPSPDARPSVESLRDGHAVALVVSDTGIGIAPEHQERIFAPFEQVDGSSGRRYGGTGLGLTIARELASLLGGELQLRSAPGRGSTFTCYLPREAPRLARDAAGRAAPSLDASASRSAAIAPSATTTSTAAGDGADKHLLVIEDDPVFAEALREIIEGQGITCLLAHGGAPGLRLAKQNKPDGIILDVKLADIDGWTVMEALRADASTASIPVHFVSAIEASERGMAMGAVGYLTKPATREQLVRVVDSLARRVGERASPILIVEDNVDDADAVIKQLESHDIEARRVCTAREALQALERNRFSCVVLDLGLPDMDGLELLQSLQERHGAEMPPVVVYTGRALSKAETQRLEAYTEAVVLKDGPASERLLDELRLFARRLKDGPTPKRAVSPLTLPAPAQLVGKRVLVVDDDMRTVYALSALLRAKGVEVLVADTGRAALDALGEHPDVELVLMDIMMPEMDGYEAMRRIRQDARFKTLPVIALTAKAMKNDRNLCLEAGATDYMAKPIDGDRLVAMLHSYLSKGSPNGLRQRA